MATADLAATRHSETGMAAEEARASTPGLFDRLGIAFLIGGVVLSLFGFFPDRRE